MLIYTKRNLANKNIQGIDIGAHQSIEMESHWYNTEQFQLEWKSNWNDLIKF